MKELRIENLLFVCAFGERGEKLIRISRFIGREVEAHCSWEWPAGAVNLLAETALRVMDSAPGFMFSCYDNAPHRQRYVVRPNVFMDERGLLFETIGWNSTIHDRNRIQDLVDFCDEFENGKVNPHVPSGREEPISA